ncbi:hypothetical protein L211DRAFT_235787 [Terfezia boudieri ATCC MYA-4762]|uniref:Crinkler effector protein N-terminal domain-containing protein n=1 Tax=Terfezia boudieri ATCC MYA-4762 TaxID=1051890 RepID=A0A3N4LL84_9PEZI|nr:hypothetical protein L211DRAFT_235787 [Terfezia boudieri ATCC MYA-4762]
METTLICWVHGDPSLAPFPIDIDWNKTIGHLKMAIVTVNPNCFNSIDAPQLELCVANIPDTEKAMNEFVFKDDNKLRGSAKIQHIIKDHFQGSLPDLTIHFAIKRPAPPPLTFDERNELLLFRAGVANKPPPSSTGKIQIPNYACIWF